MKINSKLLLSIILIPISVFGLVFLNNNASKNNKLILPKIKFAQPGAPGVHVDSIELLNNNISLNKEAKVFKLKKPNLTDQAVLNLSNKFNINGDIKSDKISKSVQDDNNSLFVFNYGGYSYINKLVSRGQKLEKVPMTDETAINKANKFLKEHNLLDKDFEQSKIENLIKEGADGSQEVERKSVFYYRKINGINVGGVSRIIVNFAENGDIQSVIGAYRDIDVEVGSFPLKNISCARLYVYRKNFLVQTSKLSNR